MEHLLLKIGQLWEATSQFPYTYEHRMVRSNKLFLPGRSGQWRKPEVFPSSSPKCRLYFWHPIPQKPNAKKKNNDLIAETDGHISYYPSLLSTNGHWWPTLGQALNMHKKNDFSKSILSLQLKISQMTFTGTYWNFKNLKF